MKRRETAHSNGSSATRAVAATRRDIWRVFGGSPSALLGLCLLLPIAGLALFGTHLVDGDHFEIVGVPHMPPGDVGVLLFGTDYLGRSVLSCVLGGAGTTLAVGFSAAFIAVAVGTLVGATAGFFGGWIDDMLMRVTEFFQVLPPLLFAMALIALFANSSVAVAWAIGVVSWPDTARLTRAEFLRIRELDYVSASRITGMRNSRIMHRVVLPNALPPLIVSATLTVGYAIMLETGLSFLGLGDPNTVSWGQMIGANRSYIIEAWWPVAFPGAAIGLTILAVTLIGDGINDALEPKRRPR